jgi:hypothetical protein
MTTEQTVDKIIDAHAEHCRGEIDTRTLLSRIGDAVEEVQKEERAKAFAKGYEKGKSYRDAIEGSIPQSMIDQQVVLAESEAYKKGYIDGSLESRKQEHAFILNVLDGIDIADGECNTKAIRKMLEARVV